MPTDWASWAALLQRSQTPHPRTGHRLCFSERQLAWRLSAPGAPDRWRVQLHRCGSLVGAVAAIPQALTVHGAVVPAVEVDLLCLDADLRGRGIGRTLIAEIQDRIEADGIQQALFFGVRGRRVPLMTLTPWHAFLQLRAVVADGAVTLERGVSVDAMVAHFECRGRPLAGLRPMVAEDVTATAALLGRREVSVARWWPPDAVAHWLLPRRGVVWTGVNGTPERGLVSFTFAQLRRGDAPPLVVARAWVLVAGSSRVDDLAAAAVHAARDRGAHLFEAWTPTLWEPALASLGFLPAPTTTVANLNRPIDARGPMDLCPL